MLPGAPFRVRRTHRQHAGAAPKRQQRLLLFVLLSLFAALGVLRATRSSWAGAAGALRGRGGAAKRKLPPHCTLDPALKREQGALAVQDDGGVSAALGGRFVIVSTWPPTKCGIASYSAGLRQGLLDAGAAVVHVVAVHLRSARPTQYGEEVRVALAPLRSTQELTHPPLACAGGLQDLPGRGV